MAARLGGHRQKRQRLDRLGGDGDADEQCPLATGLLMRWAWGNISAAEVQNLAHLAKLSGLNHSEIDFLAGIGTGGTNPNHCSRALYRRYCKGLKLPEPTVIRLPVVETKSDRMTVSYCDFPLLLPHDWMSSLATNYMEVFEERFGVAELHTWWAGHNISNPKLWQNPVLDKDNWQHLCVPLLLHGDGAQFQNRDSLVTVSMKTLLGAGTTVESHMLLAALPKSITASEKHGRAGDSWSCIWKWLKWSFTCLFEGKHPSTDPDQQPFEEGSMRWQLQGQPLCPGRQFGLL